MGRESVARPAVRHLCWTSLPVPSLAAEIVSVDPFGDRLRPGPGAGFVVLVSFLLAYLAIRTSARLTRSVSWWPGGVQTEGGVHRTRLRARRADLGAGDDHRRRADRGARLRLLRQEPRAARGVGIFIPLAALWGACRLGHPRSLWARWRYGEQKMTRAEHRFGEQRPLMRIGRRAEDLIAGAPSQPDPDP